MLERPIAVWGQSGCVWCVSGGSSGSTMYCALQAAADYQLTAEHRVVVILPDSVRNYMYEFVQCDFLDVQCVAKNE